VQRTYIDPEFSHLFNDQNLFEQTTKFDGKLFRSLENRRTTRVEKDGQRFFVKCHFGVGWREIFKNLFQLRWPVIGAGNEFKALTKLKLLGVSSLTPVLFVSEGLNPAYQRSCIITKALEGTKSLEDMFESQDVTFSLKYSLARKLGLIARTLHENGINHRDFYLCHFHYVVNGKEPSLYLIDLHRAQLRNRTPARWRIKDIGGLFFSGFNYNITPRDVFRFMNVYSGKTLRRTLIEDAGFWREAYKRAIRLYLQDHENLPGWIIRMGTKSK
tara:strand:+ start:4467 stop:5282 length:816 start_codon:yes stop_codon:yes gene_type:complete